MAEYVSGSRRLSLKDIAREAGVSVATVSYALNNRDEVSLATRKRIQELAADMGYQRSPAMSALSAYRNALRQHEVRTFETLALIHPYEEESFPGPANRTTCFQAVREHAEKLGFQLEVFACGQTAASQRRTADVLYNRGIRGVFVAPFPYTAKPLNPIGIDWSRFVAISLLNEQPSHDCHVVMPSWPRNREILVEQLAQDGVNRVGVYVGRAQATWTGGLSPLFMPEEALFDHDGGIPSVVSDNYSQASFMAWFRKHEPELVVTSIEWVPYWLRESGVRVPEDVGVVYADTVQELHRTGIDVCPALIGQAAVELMHHLLCSGSSLWQEMHFRLTREGMWNEGTTWQRRHSKALREVAPTA